jgi:hypothetical protein
VHAASTYRPSNTAATRPREVPAKNEQTDDEQEAVSKKKDRAWYVCPQLADLLPRHYASDAAAARALKTEAKIIAKLRSGTPVARSSLRKILQRYASRHPLGSPVDDLVVDIRSN